MLGFNFVKSNPTTYLIAFRNGKPVREGAGLACFYYAPTTNLVAVPIGSREQAFILEKVTADFQTVTIQGQVSFRIREPRKTAAMLNFGIRPDGMSARGMIAPGWHTTTPAKRCPVRAASIGSAPTRRVAT